MVDSLYIHYPFCKHLCHYCDFYKHISNERSANKFLSEFESSLKEHQRFLNESAVRVKPLKTLYLGGGTPSLLKEAFEDFIKLLKDSFDLSELNEFTMEIDPGTCQLKDLKNYQKAGVNRMSLGVQSFDPLIQPYLDRSHTVPQIKELLEQVSNLNINFSVDFMLGLAHPSYLKRDIEKELEEILEFNPKHVSLYILSVSESYPLAHYLPDEEIIAEEYKKVHDYLSKRKFHHYEVSNYAKENFESLHNWKYWNQESYMALGPSATGLILSADNQSFRYRWSPQYKILKEDLTEDELKLEKFYTLLRTKEGIALDEFNLDNAVISDFCKNNYGEMVSNRFRFKPHSWVILDSLVDKLL